MSANRGNLLASMPPCISSIQAAAKSAGVTPPTFVDLSPPIPSPLRTHHAAPLSHLCNFRDAGQQCLALQRLVAAVVPQDLHASNGAWVQQHSKWFRGGRVTCTRMTPQVLRAMGRAGTRQGSLGERRRCSTMILAEVHLEITRQRQPGEGISKTASNLPGLSRAWSRSWAKLVAPIVSTWGGKGGGVRAG